MLINCCGVISLKVLYLIKQANIIPYVVTTASQDIYNLSPPGYNWNIVESGVKHLKVEINQIFKLKILQNTFKSYMTGTVPFIK